ncbi:tetratricopeptide repeat protein [Roseomonas sp. E05]|uniref:tetratricopeptide repeat protein n=1 Tax=Roseomonas sp. E05 TaxID=3046310 RepID=UPI0024B8BF6C|nr:tetratricopeptide repeat protein [Roseomonas sp. E05]MDJ0391274.1 tetratricopeptide repeat protein [Roseomonas sp. E05]
MLRLTHGLALIPLFLAGGCAMSGGRDEIASRLHVAAVAEQSGQGDVALSLYAATAEQAPDRPEAQLRYAHALLDYKQPEQAMEVLRTALQKHADDPGLLAEAGRVRLALGQAEAALATYKALLRKAPRDAAGLNGQGVALDLLGRHGEAQQSYRAAQAASPDNLAAANNLALSTLLDGRADAAVALFDTLDQPGVPERVRQNHAIARAVAREVVEDPELEALAAPLR